MAGPDVRLQTLHKATRAFRDTPGREGRFVRLTDVDEILVSGDLHGHLENFRRLLALADLANFPCRHLIVQEVLHGPFRYPTGGDKSHQLLELVAALKAQYPRQVHFLPGNHELAQFTNRAVMKNNEDLNDLFREGVETAYGSRAGEVYAAYGELVAAAPVAVISPNRIFFSHSLPSLGQLPGFRLDALRLDPTPPAELVSGGSVYALAWGRDLRPDTVSAFLARVDADWLVTGHIPCDDGFERPSPQHLILDSLGQPAACAMLPALTPLTPELLTSSVRFL